MKSCRRFDSLYVINIPIKRKNMSKKLILSTILALTIWSSTTLACTNFLVTPGASVNGTAMITYAADAHVLYGELYFRPAAD